MNEYIPEIIKDNSKFTKLRNEARLNLKYVPYGNIFLNKTATKVYELCDGKYSMEDIIKFISESYPTLPKKKSNLILFQLLDNFIIWE